jgi:hypothetical protein
VRWAIIWRSRSAITAMMPTTVSLASGMSAAMNCTPLSWRANRNEALRDSRSSLAMIRRAPLTLARQMARLSSGRSFFPPLSISVIYSSSRPPLRATSV